MFWYFGTLEKSMEAGELFTPQLRTLLALRSADRTGELAAIIAHAPRNNDRRDDEPRTEHRPRNMLDSRAEMIGEAAHDNAERSEGCEHRNDDPDPLFRLEPEETRQGQDEPGSIRTASG